MLDTVLWVLVIGAGTPGDPFRADLPEAIRPRDPEAPGLSYAAEIPVEIRPGEAGHGRPIVSACRVRVRAEDAALVTNAVAPSARDEAIVEICAAKRDGADRQRMDAADARARLSALAAKHGDDKEALEEALVEGVLRGLRLSDAQAIATDLAMVPAK